MRTFALTDLEASPCKTDPIGSWGGEGDLALKNVNGTFATSLIPVVTHRTDISGTPLADQWIVNPAAEFGSSCYLTVRKITGTQISPPQKIDIQPCDISQSRAEQAGTSVTLKLLPPIKLDWAVLGPSGFLHVSTTTRMVWKTPSGEKQRSGFHWFKINPNPGGTNPPKLEKQYKFGHEDDYVFYPALQEDV